MTPETLLWRQVHPSFMEGGQPSSQVFRPTPKDLDRLSFDDGDRIDAVAAWRRFTEQRGLQSVGVLALQVLELEQQELTVAADGVPDPEHVSVAFTGKASSQRKAISKKLRDLALARGWQFRAP